MSDEANQKIIDRWNDVWLRIWKLNEEIRMLHMDRSGLLDEADELLSPVMVDDDGDL